MAVVVLQAHDSRGSAVASAAEKHRVAMVLPGQAPEADRLLEADETLDAGAGDSVTSDTGEIYRNWEKRLSWIDTPRTKAAYGMVGEAGEINLKGLKLKVDTPFAAIAISSLTDDPITASDNLLLTAIGRADNSGAKYNEDHTERLEIGHAPILIERIDAAVELETEQPYLCVRSIDPEGSHRGTVPSELKDGKLTFRLGEHFPSMYYLIQRLSGTA